MMLQISVWIYDQESSLDTHLQYENVNSTHVINLRNYEDDLHYNSLRVIEGYKAINFDEAMEKVSIEVAEEPIITGQNEKNLQLKLNRAAAQSATVVCNKFANFENIY